MRISDWSSDVCSSDLNLRPRVLGEGGEVGDVAGEAARHAAGARGDEERGAGAVARAHAGEVEGLLDMLGIALPVGDAGGLLGGVGEQVLALPRVEPGARAGRRLGSEVGDQAGGTRRTAVWVKMLL